MEGRELPMFRDLRKSDHEQEALCAFTWLGSGERPCKLLWSFTCSPLIPPQSVFEPSCQQQRDQVWVEDGMFQGFEPSGLRRQLTK